MAKKKKFGDKSSMVFNMRQAMARRHDAIPKTSSQPTESKHIKLAYLTFNMLEAMLSTETFVFWFQLKFSVPFTDGTTMEVYHRTYLVRISAQLTMKVNFFPFVTREIFPDEQMEKVFIFRVAPSPKPLESEAALIHLNICPAPGFSCQGPKQN